MSTEYDVDSVAGTVTCIYTNDGGISFTAMAKISDYTDESSAKDKVLEMAKQNETLYLKLMGDKS